MRNYRFLFIIFFIAATVYTSFVIIAIINKQEDVSLIYRTEGFSGFNLKISEKEVDSAFDNAKESMSRHAKGYKAWELVNTITTWLAFILSGIIALIAGYLGFVNQTPDQTASSLILALQAKTRTSRIIGLIAATATLLAGLSVKAKESSQDEKTTAVEIRDTIIASYKDLQNAQSESDANIVLEKLRLISEL